MKFLLIVSLWVAAVVLFILGGYFGADSNYGGHRYQMECAVEAGALGIGLATCTALGVLILMSVRSKHMTKGSAVLLLAATSAGSAILTPLSLNFGMSALSLDYRGKEALGTIAIYFMMGVAAIVAFGVFSLCVAAIQPSSKAADDAKTA
jgi:hypothetical protein